MKLTIQQWLGLAAALVAAAMVFITGFDKATDSIEVSAYIYLALGLADALLGAATAFLSTPQRMTAQLIKDHRMLVRGQLLMAEPPTGFTPPERPNMSGGRYA